MVFVGMPGLRSQDERDGTARDLLDTVVANDLCIGCGACAALPGSPLNIVMSDDGRYRASPGSEDADLDRPGGYLRVCPFASRYDEDALSTAFLETGGASHHPEIGSYRSLSAGHVVRGDLRTGGSSGGMTTWFLDRLLAEHLVDAVLHVGAQEGGSLFGYRVSTSMQEVHDNAKTRYYPVEMSEVLQRVRDTPGRYAVVGLPCFVKAVRLLQVEDETLRERIRFAVGIFCGHLKSTRFADTLAWQQGVRPGELAAIEFRKKTAVSAGAYAIETVDVHGTVRSAVNHDHLVADWGMGMFKYRACDFCDDVLNETADVAFGDAWLPGYVEDPAGTNVTVARSAEAAALIERHRHELVMDPLTEEQVTRSQAAGLRHRREGLAYRLHRARSEGRWVPEKRVAPRDDQPQWRQQVYDLRTRLVTAADAAFAGAAASSDFALFQKRLRPLVTRYQRSYERTPRQRLVGEVTRRAPWAKPVALRVRDLVRR